MEIEVDMNTLVTMVLLLAPVQPMHAALVLDTENCCSPDNRSEEIDANTLNNRGSRLYVAGDYAKAESVLREALRMQQDQASPNAATLASTYFNLAAVARMQSKVTEAESLYNRAITLRESSSGPDSPDLAHSLSGLAMVYHSQGKMTQAIELAERAVRVSANRPDDVRAIAAAHNTLATILLSKGDASKAEALERHATDELKRASAIATQEYVNALTNLGTSRLRQANYRQAESDLREAETAALQVAGPDHPLTATIWNNLSKVRAAQGDGRSAEALLGKAIAAWRKTFGPDHPDVAYGLSNLAMLYQGRKRYAEAERLFRQALQIDQAALGADSLRVANDWNSLGALALIQHHSSAAEGMLSKGLSIAQSKAPDHPDTAGIAVNLAVVYVSQARYAEASKLFAGALPVRERVLGPDSPELASILRLYAASLKAGKDYVGAERAELKATRITTHNALL